MRGLYVHVPFCVSKCFYCDFYSVTDSLDRIKTYVQSVIKESEKYYRMSFQTLYIGGGTPSLLSSENIKSLISGLAKLLDLSRLFEATMELNPESTTSELLSTLKMKGFNRVSIGVQSLVNEELKSAGRIHNARQAQSAIMEARRAGFNSISADLIIGLPGQNWKNLHYSLELLTSLGLQHLSLYCLSIEPDTPFARNPPSDLPSENEQVDLYLKACELLDRKGFIHYEISNFTLPGFECLHNLNYWRGGEYIGLGPSAASHLEGKRFKNRNDLNSYIENPENQIIEEETLPAEKKAAEEAMLRLRLLEEGLDTDQLAEKFGEPAIEGLIGRLTRLVLEGKLIRNGSKYRLPESLVMISNPIFARVLGD